MSRNPARKGPADGNHRAIREAIEAIGCPVMDLSAAGNGVEDLLVPVAVFPVQLPYEAWDREGRLRIWLPVEAKVGRPRFTVAQKRWRVLTEGWPRITATSAQNAVDQIRRLQG